jgi:DnaJ-class molecular chaperone
MQHLNIRFEDLFHVCPTCHGAGVVKESPIHSKDAPDHTGPCAVCGGKGGELTDSGMAIKRLLEKIEGGA